MPAQTRFAWPSAPVDVSHYKALDLCLAATQRVLDSTASRSAVLTDTVSISVFGPSTPLPDIVLATARRCLESIPLNTIPLRHTVLAQKVYLRANRDADVRYLLTQRMNATITDTARALAIDSTVLLLLKTQPVRLAFADSLLQDLQPLSSVWPLQDKLSRYFTMTERARVLGKYDLVQRYGTLFLATVRGMSDTEKRTPGPSAMFASAGTQVVLKILHERELLDSLTSSTKAYVSLRRQLFRQAFGTALPDRSNLGEHALPLSADYWFPSHARDTPYPRSGRVTLVIGQANSAFTTVDMASAYAIMRRLSERFPAVDIVLGVPTAGYFGPIAPPKPDEEAALIYRQITEVHETSVVLAVTKTPFWRLPDPDRRRINDAYPVSEDYQALYVSLSQGALSGVLIDTAGIVTDNISLYRDGEESLATMIEILLRR